MMAAQVDGQTMVTVTIGGQSGKFFN